MLHLDTMQIITKQQFISSITAYLKQEAKVSCHHVTYGKGF